ncbi:transporter [Algoriphagus sp. NG3]|uniref:transporter n=1 Tax=Algoriphagus sp. NG3 TaxID=3097546 RepID=UPI002A7FDE40|nr:transporter [Algoriphagus sp. NG3]WPR75315.1 transporter [Algoriphagus sp. NG3]
MKNYTKITILAIALSLAYLNAYAQGCVAIRQFSAVGTTTGQVGGQNRGDWNIATNYRYFKSFRHFSGTEEHPHRVEQGTEVINKSHFLDFGINYSVSDRMFLSAIIPLVYHDRSSMYEHGGNPPNGLGERHHTYAKGLGDIRLAANYWLVDPAKAGHGNASVGLGIKLPTGASGAEDLFYNQGADRDIDRIAVVDQSIQPGDGGYGITLDVQGFYMISHKIVLSGSLFYLANPMATNGVVRRGGNPETPEFDEFSVPDQYAVRLGASYMTPLPGVSLYGGGRMECLPASDLFGSSEGYRRPGYVISVEPGLTYSRGNFAALLSVPIAVERNRTKNYTDKIRGTHGDAAFADYSVNVGVTWLIPRKSAEVFNSL